MYWTDRDVAELCDGTAYTVVRKESTATYYSYDIATGAYVSHINNTKRWVL